MILYSNHSDDRFLAFEIHGYIFPKQLDVLPCIFIDMENGVSITLSWLFAAIDFEWFYMRPPLVPDKPLVP